MPTIVSSAAEGVTWVLATGSPQTGGVEVAITPTCVYMRHAGRPDENVLMFTLQEWDAFSRGVLNAEFNI